MEINFVFILFHLQRAVKDNHVEILDKLLEILPKKNNKKYVDKRAKANHKSKSLLHFASEKGAIDVIDYLIKEGADINIQDTDRKTPIIYSIIHNQLDVLEYFIQQKINGKNVNLALGCRKKLTPLHYAAGRNSVQFLKAFSVLPKSTLDPVFISLPLSSLPLLLSLPPPSLPFPLPPLSPFLSLSLPSCFLSFNSLLFLEFFLLFLWSPSLEGCKLSEFILPSYLRK